MVTKTEILSAEQFSARDWPEPCELVRGVVNTMNRPNALHGHVCGNVVFLLKTWAKAHQPGFVMGNDTGVITDRNPDSVRGPDVMYVKAQRLPDGPPAAWLEIPPDLAVEVLSPNELWSQVIEKIGEYFRSGVPEIWRLDPDLQSIQIHVPDRPPHVFTADKQLVSPNLPGLQCGLAELFSWP